MTNLPKIDIDRRCSRDATGASSPPKRPVGDSTLVPPQVELPAVEGGFDGVKTALTAPSLPT